MSFVDALIVTVFNNTPSLVSILSFTDSCGVDGGICGTASVALPLPLISSVVVGKTSEVSNF